MSASVLKVLGKLCFANSQKEVLIDVYREFDKYDH